MREVHPLKVFKGVYFARANCTRQTKKRIKKEEPKPFFVISLIKINWKGSAYSYFELESSVVVSCVAAVSSVVSVVFFASEVSFVSSVSLDDP